MSTSQFTTFTVGPMMFGVEIGVVQEMLGPQPITPVPLAPHAATGLINLRGQVVTAIDLRSRLGLVDRPAGEQPANVVVRVGASLVSLLVDAIGDVVDVTPDQFEEAPRTVAAAWAELIHGAYKLDTGLLLSLDVERAVGVDAIAETR
jgi:purine-binding chemotaxis protein CheW